MSLSWSEVIVRAKRQEAAGVHVFTLGHPQARELEPFTPGAHIDLEIAPGLIRQYSLVSSPADRGAYEIAVLRDAKSRGGSIALIDRVAVGATLRMSGPRNQIGRAHV